MSFPGVSVCWRAAVFQVQVLLLPEYSDDRGLLIDDSRRGAGLLPWTPPGSRVYLVETNDTAGAPLEGPDI